jgi:toxin ParE1/3/4
VARKRGHLKVVLSPEARRDLKETLKWTIDRFGRDAALRYEYLIVQGLRDIEEDLERPGSLERSDIQSGIRTYHLRFSRDRARSSQGVVHKPRHFIIYRSRERRIDILRILHDGRDLQRHLPE